MTRAEWGADESLRKADPVIAPVKMAFVHHTAGGNTYSQADAPALVRGIYTYHVKSLGWSDIGYNFLLDRFGTIYEGRYGGVRKGVVGAQVYGFNTGSTGISVIGTYTSEMPPPAVLSALRRLLAWKLDLHGLDPLGAATMTCGATEKFKEGETVDASPSSPGTVTPTTPSARETSSTPGCPRFARPWAASSARRRSAVSSSVPGR